MPTGSLSAAKSELVDVLRADQQWGVVESLSLRAPKEDDEGCGGN
jgi:hypothetical protein